MGLLWGLLVLLWGPLGLLCGPLGLLWGCCGAPLGPVWALSGPFLATWEGPQTRHFEPHSKCRLLGFHLGLF